MQKKHDEGYALVFVLVVMTVLGIIAVSLMTGALSNIKRQTATVERMQEKYTAQGELERQIVLMADAIGKCASGTQYTRVSEAQKKITESIPGMEWENEGTSRSCKKTFVIESGSVRIDCKVVFEGVISTESGGGEVIRKPSGISYESYNITRVSPTETPEGGASE